MDAKVRDYPDLIKRGGGVVNTNHDEYLRAKARLKQAKRIDNLESEVRGLHSKLDILIGLLQHDQSK
ncbi:hypothetical protein [Xanthomonas phage X1]|nr:hypothetical protein [Xanthomonas phage X1]